MFTHLKTGGPGVRETPIRNWFAIYETTQPIVCSPIGRQLVDKLLPLLLREFPDFDPAQAFEAGIPVYYTRLAIEVLEPQKLTSFQSYFLHAVALGVNTQEKLAHLLG